MHPEPPNTAPHLNIQQEISPLATHEYLQARDEAVVTLIPPFHARGNSAFCTTTLEKKVCVCVHLPIILRIIYSNVSAYCIYMYNHPLPWQRVNTVIL